MKDVALEQTFVSYWTIAQTLATQSRFWLDDAIAHIVTDQVIKGQRYANTVLSSSMLRNGGLNADRSIAEMGEVRLEHRSNKRAWRESVQKAALQRIDLLVGQQERTANDRGKQKIALGAARSVEAEEHDARQMNDVANSLGGPPSDEVVLQCNLLVIEPDRNDRQLHAWAIRYVNPKTFASHPTRKQERVNALRLYALLVQEKILRDPKSIHVCVAELTPRRAPRKQSDTHPEYFSSKSFWSSEQLWQFIGIPFTAVQIAIGDVANEFRQTLHDGLRGLLPESHTGPYWRQDSK